jgi:uncharacterized membrane protein YbhN (UPF0104 family)
VTRPALKITLQYGIGLALLAYVIISNWHVESIAADGTREEVGLARALEQPVNWRAFVVAGLIFSACAFLTFVRWHLLVRAQGLEFPFANAFRLGLVGLYFSAFLPGSVGGDIVKAFAIAREQSRRTVAVATILLDRLIGLCALFWLVTLVGGVLGITGTLDVLVEGEQARAGLRFIVLVTTCLSLGSLVFWFAMGFFSEDWSESMGVRLEGLPKIGHALAELWRAVWLYRRRGASVAMALGLSLVGHVGFVLSFYFAARALLPAHDMPSLLNHILIVPVGFTIQAGFPTPGGIGGAEVGFGALYRLVGSTVAAGTLASLSYRIINWVLGILGYVVYLRTRRRIAPATESIAEGAAPSQVS